MMTMPSRAFTNQPTTKNVVEATTRAQLDAQEVASFYTMADTATVTTIAVADSAVATATRTRRRGRRASMA